MTQMSFRMPGFAVGGEPAATELLARLVRDLERYARQGGPTAAELQAAPLIRTVEAVPDATALRLAGFVTGHPRIGPGPGVTSQIHAIDDEGRWVRSLSRLWRIDGLPIIDPNEAAGSRRPH